jgi:vacuolar iron transporter family protein
VVSAAALIFLAMLGALGAWLGGAPPLKATIWIAFWGALAMAVTAGIGALIGRVV